MQALAILTRGHVTRQQVIQHAAAATPLPPAEAQSLLVKSLELPLPPSLTTEINGIHQSDVIIRSALVAAIADIRANPWLLDYCFAGLAKDEQTMGIYGEKDIAAAKKWFTSTAIPVTMSTNLDKPSFPRVTITLLESVESEVTLGDVHYQPREDNDSQWPALADPFTPVTYNASSGQMTVPDGLTSQLILAQGMFIIDRAGRPHEILDFDGDIATIKAGTVADFTGAVVKGARPAYVTNIESVIMRETYHIGCHVQGEPVHLMYLHSIITFILYRYKEALLEARGFERSVPSSSDFMYNGEFGEENVFSRHINLSGYVRQSWPKAIAPKVTSVTTAATPDEDWLDDQDALLVKLK